MLVLPLCNEMTLHHSEDSKCFLGRSGEQKLVGRVHNIEPRSQHGHREHLGAWFFGCAEQSSNSAFSDYGHSDFLLLDASLVPATGVLYGD